MIPLGHDMKAMSGYISRLLPAISALTIDPDSLSQAITSVSTSIGETLMLHEVCSLFQSIIVVIAFFALTKLNILQPIPTDIDIFDWLFTLIQVMKSSVAADLSETLKCAIFEFDNLNEEHWMFHFTTGLFLTP